jgi:hypothetical protein
MALDYGAVLDGLPAMPGAPAVPTAPGQGRSIDFAQLLAPDGPVFQSPQRSPMDIAHATLGSLSTGQPYAAFADAQQARLQEKQDRTIALMLDLAERDLTERQFDQQARQLMRAEQVDQARFMAQTMEPYLTGLTNMQRAGFVRAVMNSEAAGGDDSPLGKVQLIAETAARLGYEPARTGAAAGAPTTREFKVGDQLLTMQWDPAGAKWVPMAEAPRATPGAPTLAGVVAPLLEKMARGEMLTPGEQNTLNVYMRMSPEDRFLQDLLGGAGYAPPTPAMPTAPAAPSVMVPTTTTSTTRMEMPDGRTIHVEGGRWVYDDTGQPVE